MKYYLGIDIGTSGCKAAIFDITGQMVSFAYREYELISPQSGWAELNTDEVMECCFRIIKEAASVLPYNSVAGIGISSQGEAFTLIDSKGSALSNAFVSSDTRADKYAKEWPESFGARDLYQITGHTPHPMFTLFKILWVKDNMPDIWLKTSKIHCFEDLLQYRLGIKKPAMGWPLAGRTMLFDVLNHCWSSKILNAAEIDPGLLPGALKSGSVVGYVDKKIARLLNLSDRTVIVTGGHDQPCSALGAGAIEPGMAVYATGTVECITPAFATPVFTDDLYHNNFCTYDHAAPGLYATVAFSLTGGNVLKWFRDQFGSIEINDATLTDRNPYDLLLEKIPPEPTDLLVLPYFTPSGTPYFDTRVKGAIMGLDLNTKREEILKALIEGVAFEIKLNLKILEESGYSVNELRVIGGGAKSKVLNQLKANVINKPITLLNVTEAGCMAGAILAAAAVNRESVSGISGNWVKVIEKFEPADHNFYNRKFLHYLELYPHMKKLGFYGQ